jgi:hypothetical protein
MAHSPDLGQGGWGAGGGGVSSKAEEGGEGDTCSGTWLTHLTWNKVGGGWEGGGSGGGDMDDMGGGEVGVWWWGVGGGGGGVRL